MTMRRLALAALLVAAPFAFAADAQSPQPRAQARYEQSLSPRAITAVQQRLRQHGYYRGRIDGVWGRGTQAALARFQEEHRLEVTAQLNPATAKALNLGPDVVLGNAVNVQAPTSADAAQPLSPRAISAVQHRLRQQGYYRGRADGVWGRGTEAAVARFQQAHRLEVTGRLNPDTARALKLPGYVADVPPPPSAQPLSRNVVRVVQDQLRGAGFYAGPRDGAWGPRTAEAVAGFQRSRGLPSTGELNPATISALGLDPNNLSAETTYRRRSG
jgi:peptidoglycan hydrolase-like protein with peptidoglycan-binding domain